MQTRVSFAVRRAVPILMILGMGYLPGESAAQEPGSLESLTQRMDAIQAELDAAALRIETLWATEESLRLELATTDLELKEVERKHARLGDQAVELARDLYMGRSDPTIEAVLGSEDLSEMAAQLQYLSTVGETNDRLFIEQGRAAEVLHQTSEKLEGQITELAQIEESLGAASEVLQAKFAEAKDEYDVLKRRLAARERAEARALAAEGGAAQGDTGPASRAGKIVCPVDGPNSFIDSWGFPRSGGRSHEGTDIMAAFDTPLVAMEDGVITYAGVGSLSGNWIVLTTRSGDEYMYMHNKVNLVTEGRVQAGQKIATVGDSGNAIGGPPHVHFEQHPGGGDPVNPYPLLAKVC